VILKVKRMIGVVLQELEGTDLSLIIMIIANKNVGGHSMISLRRRQPGAFAQ
jgi:hypothetical protein